MTSYKLISFLLQCATKSTTVNAASQSPVVDLTHTATAPTLASQKAKAYSLKIINRKKKAEFVVQTLRMNGQFTSLDNLKAKVKDECGDKVDPEIEQLGYIEPGHGLRGKQRWLNSDEDLREMYVKFRGKEITLWCFGRDETPQKRPHSPDKENQPKKVPRSGRYDEYTRKMTEVEDIELKLREKHDGQYTEEQLRAWAHLVQLKKHSSMDVPPDKPFWRGHKKRPNPAPTTPEKQQPGPSGAQPSPGKCVQMWGQCVDQLLKWHELLEKGGINQQQYDEMKSTIMSQIHSKRT